MLTPPYTPELLAAVTSDVRNVYLKGSTQPKVLEYGSGWSTLWFANLGCEVVSFEHDFVWYTDVNRALALRDRSESPVQVVMTEPAQFRTLTAYLPFNYFDLVYVDCIDARRVECAVAGGSKLRKGGHLVLDDTHWPLWYPLLRSMEKRGYEPVKKYKGDHVRKDGQTHYHETTVYRKG